MHSVVFDLDDTLYDRTQPLRKAFLEMVVKKDISFEQFYSIYQNYSDIAFDEVKDGKMTLKESHIFRISETLLDIGMRISKEEAERFQEAYAKYQQQIEPYPFILEILHFLRNKGVNTFIITNGPTPNQRNKIKHLGLNPYFKPEEIIVSSEEGAAKPDRKIFEAAEQRFNLIKNHTWYVGDSFTHDIIGAANSGWHTIWLNNHKKPQIDPSYSASKVVNSTLELKEYLIDLFQSV